MTNRRGSAASRPTINLTLERLEERATPAEIALVKNIAGSGDSSPNDLVQFNGELFFTANDGTHGIELWTTEGTEAGTAAFILTDAQGQRIEDPYPQELTVVGGKLFFVVDYGTGIVGQRELWVTNGTAEGTRAILDLQGKSLKVGFQDLTAVGDKLYFTADDGNGREIWVSDGTDLGTAFWFDANGQEKVSGTFF